MSHAPTLIERGVRIAEHPAPYPARRRIAGWLAATGLILIAAGSLALLTGGIVWLLPLVALMGLILGGLSLPLLLATVLHPAITVYERGLWLQPLIWRGTWVPWDAITAIEPHTLIRRGEAARFAPAYEGDLIVVDGALPRVYAVVGVMAGLGRQRAFGIASHGQVEYPRLAATIRDHALRR